MGNRLEKHQAIGGQDRKACPLLNRTVNVVKGNRKVYNIPYMMDSGKR